MKRLPLLGLLLLSVFPSVARADDADVAWAEAQALARAELWPDCLAALDRAIAVRRDFAPALLLRARVRARLELPGDLDAALSRGDVGNWQKIQTTLASLIKDLTGYLAAAPATDPDRPAAQGELDTRTRQSSRLQQLKAELEHKAQEQQQAAANAAEQKRLADLAAANAEQQRIANEQRQARFAELNTQREALVEDAHLRRGWGIALLCAGAAGAGGAAALFAISNGRYASIMGGGFKTASDIQKELDNAGTERTGSLALTIIGGGALLAGVLLVISGREPPPVEVGALFTGNGGGVSVSGSWP